MVFPILVPIASLDFNIRATCLIRLPVTTRHRNGRLEVILIMVQASLGPIVMFRPVGTA